MKKNDKVYITLPAELEGIEVKQSIAVYPAKIREIRSERITVLVEESEMSSFILSVPLEDVLTTPQQVLERVTLTINPEKITAKSYEQD